MEIKARTMIGQAIDVFKEYIETQGNLETDYHLEVYMQVVLDYINDLEVENEQLKAQIKEYQKALDETIDKIKHILNNQINYREFVDIVNDIGSMERSNADTNLLILGDIKTIDMLKRGVRMKIEDYNKYYIQGSDHYLIPKDVLEELFNEMVNWKEENEQLKDKLSKIETLIINHNCDTGDIYYKYNSRFLKSELKQRILEIVYEQGSDSNVKK